MSAITADAYIQGQPVYTNLLAGTETPTIDPAIGRAMYDSHVRPEDISAPMVAPVYVGPPAQTFDLSRLLARSLTARAGQVPSSGDDELALTASRPAIADALRVVPDVPEPGVLVLLALGCAALARRVRR
jgi:hypothetical protein